MKSSIISEWSINDYLMCLMRFKLFISANLFVEYDV